MDRKIFIYGIGGANDNYRVVAYQYIKTNESYDIVRDCHAVARWLRYRNPSIKYAYAIGEGADLARMYKKARKTNSVEDNVCFKLMLEETGLVIKLPKE